jgi:hypothetical protein
LLSEKNVERRKPCCVSIKESHAIFLSANIENFETFESIREKDQTFTNVGCMNISLKDNFELIKAAFPVGTLISERPPDSSEQAQFGHSAPTLGV